MICFKKKYTINNLKRIFFQSVLEVRYKGDRKGFFKYWYAFKLRVFLVQGRHEDLRALAKSLRVKKYLLVSNFYLAHSYFLFSEYEISESYLKEILRNYPHHPDSVYLLIQIYKINNKELAWAYLEKLALKSSRLKTWLYISQMVESEKDYYRMLTHLSLVRDKKIVPFFNKNINEYVAQAALRVKKYEDAKSVWKESIENLNLDKKKNIKKSDVFLFAEDALKDLDSAFKEEGIIFFLISGTLLGCIREKSLLKHDKDIDVGVWQNVPLNKVQDCLRKKGLFYIHPQRSTYLLRVTHVSGVAIDVFCHYEENEYYWHGGVKVKWINRKFTLTPRFFLGGEYNIPKNWDLYLKENYGDWRVEKKVFDNVFDAPNSIILNEDEVVIHCYKELIKSIEKMDELRINFYMKKLNQFGEFVNLVY